MAQVEERTVLKREAPELFERVEQALAESDGVVDIDGKSWRVVDFNREEYAVLLPQFEER